ncbi:uncharacterized protein N7498_006795 [Penicillium cinerascens]|uniref:Zn(2)-C6 fungal-type domain-containing protein n=1 Tax=Penicillium cinerascens TaxID=70096 RepID=A0A9W9MJ52_9EURO|nr:uncharacterized protein N7498_006795 [Penicillium cinerascens]KAJ5202132.1 hypothetical protein N7498_006795 [Penicillium cinerascens]
MHSALNYRQSRRSACDRCRGFKLRCERDQVNGRSCERCLKAQVVCTTSVGQPAPHYLPSKGDSGTLSRDCNRVLTSERMPMPVLHRSSASKVRKPLASSGASRRQVNQYSSCWRSPDSVPPVSTGNVSSVENIGLQMSSLPGSVLPVEQWRDPFASWGLESYDFPFPQAVMMDRSLNFQNESDTETYVPFNLGTFGFTDQTPNPTMDGIWNPHWESIYVPTMDDEPPIPTTTDRASTSLFGLRKRLLRLDLDLIDDLELLESGSIIMGPSCLLKGDISPTIGKLDLPIFRMLSHSKQFMGILESGSIATEDSYNLATGLKSSEKAPNSEHDTNSPPTDIMGSTVEDVETTSSYDSGYLTMMESSPDQARRLNHQRCDISTSLSILAAYCHLIRVYRAIFTQLYQLFLIIPPADAAKYLLLPNLQFGQFHMDGNLTVQVQVLIELGSSMLAKIERALGMTQAQAREANGEISPVAYILDGGPLVSIRDHIMAQEHEMCGITLKETMNCLRQLLKDPANM